MIGKSFREFIDELYCNPEMEFIYRGERYMLSGYVINDQYVLEVTQIDTSSTFFKTSSKSRNDCVTNFVNAPIFNTKTIYEAEEEIEVLYG